MLILRIVALAASQVMVFAMFGAREYGQQNSTARQTSVAAGKKTYLRFCASCHGEGGKGDGPAATALQPPPSDLTTLSRRHEGKYPAGYVAAVLIFGKSFAAHGSEDMPVWGSRFKALDPAKDPTGQQHVDDVVSYIGLLQTK